MKKKILKLLMIVMVFSLISNQIIYSHSSSQAGTISWGETIGWSINEQLHTNSTSFAYRFLSSDRFLTDTYKTIIRNGASKWSSYGTISESSSSTGIISTFLDDETGEWASLYHYTCNTYGHFTTWQIRFNRAKNFTAVTAAHEFGHIFGLMDL